MIALAEFVDRLLPCTSGSALAGGLMWLWLLQVPDCRIVLLVGLSLMIVPVAVMCCFNDDRSLGESSEAKRCEPGCLLQLFLCLLNPPLSGDCPTNDLLWRSSSSLDSPHESSIFMHMHAIQQDAM